MGGNILFIYLHFMWHLSTVPTAVSHCSTALPKGNWWSTPLEYFFTGILIQLADTPIFTWTAGETAAQNPIKCDSWL